MCRDDVLDTRDRLRVGEPAHGSSVVRDVERRVCFERCVTYESEALEALSSVDLSEAIGDAGVHGGVSLDETKMHQAIRQVYGSG